MSQDMPTIHQLMGRVLAELPAVGKTQENREQGFHFRGHDDVMNALNPVLSKHGVFVLPRVLERERSTRQTRSGGTMYEVNLHVKFTFYGPAGDFVEASVWGEGTDMGDKATSKAMTSAFKYCLVEAFSISTKEVSLTDADRTTPENTVLDAVACRWCGAEVEGAALDKEPMRFHVVTVHNWVRQADGTVAPPSRPTDESQDRPPEPQESPAGVPATPDVPPTPETPAETPTPSSTPVVPGTVEHQIMVPAEDSPQSPQEPVDQEEDLYWIDQLKGKDLTQKAKDLGLSPSGKVEEIRARVRRFVTGQLPGEPISSKPAQGGLDFTPSEASTQDSPEPTVGTDAEDEVQTWQCPECNAFPFDTEAEYHEHWYATHGDNSDTEAEGLETSVPAEDEPSQPDLDGPASEDLVGMVKVRIGNLTGESARAYGKYRREKTLGRPDQMTARQATELLEFLDRLGAAVPA